MKRRVDLLVHLSRWCFVPEKSHPGEWEWTGTWLAFTLRIVWPPPVTAVLPNPLYQESRMTTHFPLSR